MSDDRPRPRVLVTGAGGFVGRRLVARRPDTWDTVALSRQEIAPGEGLRTVRVRDVEAPLPRELSEPFDAVIHLAGNADHGLAAREPWRDVAATAGVAAALLTRIRTRRVVVLSSAAVYAGLEGPVGPGRCLEPTMPYALSKRYVEGLVSDLVQRGRVESALVLRLYNVFGPGERPSRLIPRVVAASRQRETFLLTGDPHSLSDPLHIDAVVDALISAARTSTNGVLDLCGGEPTPLIDQIARIANALELTIPKVESKPDPDQVPIRFWSDPTPSIRALDLAPRTTFKDSVRQYGLEMGWLR